MISKDAAIAQFKSILGTASSWVVLAKSQFMEHLCIFQSWALRDALWKIERAQQEFFLSTALNDSSIRTHAEDREYVPRKATPSRGMVRIANNGTAAVSFPENTPLISEAQLDYLLETAVTVPAGGHVDVEAAQFSYAPPMRVAVSEAEPFLEVVFPRDTVSRLSRFAVSVDEGDGFEPWEYRRLFQNALPTDQVYDEFYTHSGQNGVRFGNGTFGKMPPLNAIIEVEYWLTEGQTSLIAGQELSPVEEILDAGGNAAEISIVTLEEINGGGAPETVAEMRPNLHYWQRYMGKVVWDDDYAFYVKSRVPGITWIKVWGEEEQEAESGFSVANINKIFVSAYAPGNSDLETDVLAVLSEIPLLNRKYAWVAPVLSSYTVTVTGKVSRSADLSTALSAVKAVLSDSYGPDSAARTVEVRLSDLYDLLKQTGYFEGAGTYYQITLSGTTAPAQLKEMVSLDLDASTFTLTYP